jgi:hypothetical protein
VFYLLQSLMQFHKRQKGTTHAISFERDGFDTNLLSCCLLLIFLQILQSM